MPTTIKHGSRQAWLADRREGKYLGASQVAAAIGQDPFCSPFSLWARLTGLLTEEDLALQREEVEWGLRNEPAILDAFADKTGRLVKPNADFEVIQHDDLPYFRSTLDATQWAQERDGPGDLQAKTASTFVARQWENGQCPLHHQIQVQAELAVSGMAWGSLAVLVGGNRFKWFDLERDQSFIDALLPHIERFWWHVEHRKPPEVDASVATSRVLQKLHPEDNGMTVELSGEALAWHEEFQAAKAKRKALEELEQLNENRLKAAIGDATFALLPDGTRYSYKRQTVKEHVRRESTFRVLRLTKG